VVEEGCASISWRRVNISAVAHAKRPRAPESSPIRCTTPAVAVNHHRRFGLVALRVVTICCILGGMNEHALR
jgi:hypothetical protein